MVNCIVPVCKEYTGKRINKEKCVKVTFHKFPNDPVKKKEWADRIGVHVGAVRGFSRICSCHFPDDMIDRTSLSCVRLRDNAVPCINTGQAEKSELNSCTLERMDQKEETILPESEIKLEIEEDTDLYINSSQNQKSQLDSSILERMDQSEQTNSSECDIKLEIEENTDPHLNLSQAQTSTSNLCIGEEMDTEKVTNSSAPSIKLEESVDSVDPSNGSGNLLKEEITLETVWMDEWETQTETPEQADNNPMVAREMTKQTDDSCSTELGSAPKRRKVESNSGTCVSPEKISNSTVKTALRKEPVNQQLKLAHQVKELQKTLRQKEKFIELLTTFIMGLRDKKVLDEEQLEDLESILVQMADSDSESDSNNLNSSLKKKTKVAVRIKKCDACTKPHVARSVHQQSTNSDPLKKAQKLQTSTDDELCQTKRARNRRKKWKDDAAYREAEKQRFKAYRERLKAQKSQMRTNDEIRQIRASERNTQALVKSDAERAKIRRQRLKDDYDYREAERLRAKAYRERRKMSYHLVGDFIDDGENILKELREEKRTEKEEEQQVEEEEDEQLQEEEEWYRNISTFMKLPKKLQNKRAIVNIQNHDPFSFLWSVTAAICPTEKHPNRKGSYPHFQDVLKYDGIKFPIVLKDIPKFEVMNGLSINVYSLKDAKSLEKIVPIYLSNTLSTKPTIHLFMIKKTRSYDDDDDDDQDDKDDNDNSSITIDEDVTDDNIVYHFGWIRSLSRLLRSQISKSKHSIWVCDRCLMDFKHKRSLRNHIMECH